MPLGISGAGYPLVVRGTEAVASVFFKIRYDHPYPIALKGSD
jgi:hypothetical protein